MRCFVYRNLTRKGFVYSLKALEGPYKGRVVAHASKVLILDAIFHVSQAGLTRARRERQRNVHAGIVGRVCLIREHNNRLPHSINTQPVMLASCKDGELVTYNPWKYDTFVTRNDEQPIYEADVVKIDHQLVSAHSR